MRRFKSLVTAVPSIRPRNIRLPFKQKYYYQVSCNIKKKAVEKRTRTGPFVHVQSAKKIKHDEQWRIWIYSNGQKVKLRGFARSEGNERDNPGWTGKGKRENDSVKGSERKGQVKRRVTIPQLLHSRKRCTPNDFFFLHGTRVQGKKNSAKFLDSKGNKTRQWNFE